MNNEPYYRLELDDYALPGFVSSGKYYFGTIDDIRGFISALSADPQTKEPYKKLTDAFRAYMDGQADVTHWVAYREVPLIVPATVLYRTETSLTDHQWEHLNIWGWPYVMRCDKADAEHLWISCEEEWTRCVKVTFQKLQYEQLNGSWEDIGRMLWGFPHILEWSNQLCRNRLAVHEESFETKEEAERDWITFQPSPCPNFTGFCNEIFGDG